MFLSFNEWRQQRELLEVDVTAKKSKTCLKCRKPTGDEWFCPGCRADNTANYRHPGFEVSGAYKGRTPAQNAKLHHTMS
jgi:hypothetical protein